MTEHPAKDCTADEIAVFEQIGIGHDLGHHSKIINTLLRKELIERHLSGYEMPIPIHMQWCAWCSENVTDEELEEGPDSPAEHPTGGAMRIMREQRVIIAGLLAALKELLLFGSSSQANIFAIRDRARAAIAKAEGEK